MKRHSLLFLSSILCLNTVSMYAARKENRVNTRTKHINVRVQNTTETEFEKVSATFKFIGKNNQGKPFIEGTVTTQLDPNKGYDFKSEDAIYNEKNIKEYFGREPYYVVLSKIIAGRWRVAGTDWMVRSARLKFKGGTQQEKFKIILTKNRIGIPVYRIQPLISKQLTAAPEVAS